jgi:hypothetical protein
MNESMSSTTPRTVAPWVAPVIEELGKLSDLTLEGLSCFPDSPPEDCFPV